MTQVATRLVDAVEDFLVALSVAKPSPHTLAAYRRDLLGVARRVATAQGVALDELALAALDKASLRRGFAAWAADHAKASTIRAWSSWNAFFRHLVAEDLVEGNPMAGVGRPRRPTAPVKVIRGTDVTARLLATAAVADPRARHPWPERDTALVDVRGDRHPPGRGTGAQCRLPVRAARRTAPDRGGQRRQGPGATPLPRARGGAGGLPGLRAARFPSHDLDRPTTALFVHHRGQALTARQVQYLIERLYVRTGLRAQVPPGALVHALRHTFPTTALEAGPTWLEVQQLLGHASLDTTRRYLEATASELRDAVWADPSHLALQHYLLKTTSES